MARFERGFHTQLSRMVGKRVSLSYGTPISVTGELLAVMTDYIVVATAEIPELLVQVDDIRCIGATTDA